MVLKRDFENEESMKDFIKLSRYAGMREDLVQAGGGNSSCKISGDKMFIKASGFQLADITETKGYALVNPSIILDYFLSADIDTMTDEDGMNIMNKAFIKGEKPSIETFLHAVSGKYTLHTHPIVVNALACRKDGMDVLRELFPNSLSVPYATPGTELAKAYFLSCKKMTGNEKIPETVFLQNHGLVVSGETAQAVIDKTEEITYKIETYLKTDLQKYHDVTRIWNLFDNKIIWRVTDINVVCEFKKCGFGWRHAFCPDCVVFLGRKIWYLDKKTAVKDKKEFEKRYGTPVLVCYKEELYIVADSVKKAFEIQSVLSFSAQVMEINKDAECNFLSEREQNYLLNWDAEKYRKSIK